MNPATAKTEENGNGQPVAKKYEMYPSGKCVRCRTVTDAQDAQDGSRWCHDCAVNAPRCRECNKYPAGIRGNTRTPLCWACIEKRSQKPASPSKAKLAEIREQKRMEMIERGELCYRCEHATPDPGHELCYKCEQATAKRPAKPKLGRMPESCMYGWCGDFARQMDSPLDAAYPAVLAIAAGYGVPNAGSLRPNLYVSVVGEKGTGKTRVIDRIRESWQPPSETMVSRRYPGSEIGLIQIMGGKKQKELRPEDYNPKPFLLVQDEIRVTFNKMDIKGSSLPNMLNDLFYHDDFGTASKQGSWTCCARLSVVGGLTCDGPDDFAEVYGAATCQGTFDRTIFGLFPPDWEFDDLWQPPVVSPGADITDNLPVMRRPQPCAVPAWAYEKVKVWKRGNPETRRRLGELALRVALITSSMNHDRQITEECLRCAIEFIEWQEAIRAEYSPSETDDLDGRAERAVIRALEKQPDWIEWRDLCQKNNLHRAAKSAVRLNRVKKALIYEQIIEEEYEMKEDGTRGERSGRVRLMP
jgi:hypothetical protein